MPTSKSRRGYVPAGTAAPSITVINQTARRPNVVKHGPLFLVVDQDGQVATGNDQGCGLFDQDSRLLNVYQWSSEETTGPNVLTLLNTTFNGPAATFIYGVSPAATSKLTGDKTLTIRREVVIDGQSFLEGLTLTNHHTGPVTQRLRLRLGNDFAHNFQYRSCFADDKRGRLMEPKTTKRTLTFAYVTMDSQLAETVVTFTGITPDTVTAEGATFDLSLPAGESLTIEVRVDSRLSPVTESGGRFLSTAKATGSRRTRRSALQFVKSERQRFLADTVVVTTGNTTLDLALRQGTRDIHLLLTPTPGGHQGIVAGTPVFVRHFGRDGAISGSQVCPVMRSAALGTVWGLAEHQGTKVDEFTGEQVGRIAHEPVTGELARCNLIPHKFSSIDATPLFIRLVGQCYAWTGDMEFLSRIWPQVEAALNHLSPVENGGFLSYIAQNALTLANQSWMDSGDSMRFKDGRLATPPLAVCDVQAFLYEAWQTAAYLADVLGHGSISDRLKRSAAGLKERFNAKFWMKSEGYLALAIQGDGQQVNAIGSNAGHCLGIGLLDSDRETEVAERLLQPELFSGYGIRTKAKNEKCFNPVGYHNGSVWAWDTASIVAGLCRMGRYDLGHRVFQGMLAALQQMPDHRLPELFCGFDRDDAIGPVSYPGACCPQAWSTGAVYQMLMACLGLKPLGSELQIVKPNVPTWLGQVSIEGLMIGSSRVDLTFRAEAGSTKVTVDSNPDAVKIVIKD